MPYLDQLANGTDSDVDLCILSVIGFPSDRRRQRAWVDKARNARTEWFLKEHPLAMLPDDQTLHARVIAAATDPHHLALGSEKTIGIDTAGYRVTAYLLVRVLASRPHGSLNEAIDAFIRAGGHRVKVPGASEATIRRWWRDYKSAAHLAAAFLFHRDSLWADPAGMGMRTGYSPIGAGWALAWAESVRIAGEQYKPPHSRKPLLDPKLTWKMPPSLQLPNVPLDLPPPERVTFTP
jgi:hypothetical protein